jgi:DNA-binding CsgD family transcriptional regulator
MTGGLSDEDYAAVEAAAYEAAIVPELWPGVLSRLGQISNSAGAALLAMNERGVHLVWAPEVEKAARRFLNEGWVTRNGRAGGVVAKGLVGVPRFVNEDDYFDPGGAEADPMVRDLFRAEGLGWAAGFLVQLPHGDMIVMNVEQFYERGPIRGDDLARLDSLYPHLARAALLSGRADFERVRTAIETLTALGLPAAALTPTGRVVLANDDFNQASHVWVTRGGDKLGLHDRTANAMLTSALDALKLARSPRSIPIRAEAGGPITSVIQVVPIRRTAHDIFGSTVAIVVLSEPRSGMAGATMVQSLFDLTPAEISVVQAIVGGQTIAQIATATNRSVETIRNQLKTAMAKTGCTRQVELVLLVRQLTDHLPRE